MRNYSIDESVKSEGTAIKTFDGGINENVVLKAVKYDLASTKPDADPSGAKVLIFEFETTDGEKSFRHLEWEVNEQASIKGAETLYDMLVRDGKTPKESKAEFVNNQVDKAYNSQATRIKHIMTKFMPEEDTVIRNVNTFAQFATAVAAKFKTVDLTTKLHVLCIYDKGGYIKFPSFTPFVEVAVDGANPTLKVNLKYHKITPPAAQPASTGTAVSDSDEF